MFDRIRAWWADDWHIIPRLCRDYVGWMAGGQNVRVGLWTITYDPATGWQHHDYKRVAKKDLPADAVHVTGKGNKEFAHDLDDSGSYPQPGDFTASDAFIIAKTYVCDVDAILTEKRTDIDGRTLAMILGALCLIGIVWFVYRVLV